MSDRLEPANNEPLKPLKPLRIFLEKTKNTNNINMISQRNHIQKIYDELKQYDKKFLSYITTKTIHGNPLIMLINAINKENLDTFPVNNIYNKIPKMLPNYYKLYMTEIFNTIKQNNTIKSSILQPTVNHFIKYVNVKSKSKSKSSYPIANEQLLSDYKNSIIKLQQIPNTPPINA